MLSINRLLCQSLHPAMPYCIYLVLNKSINSYPYLEIPGLLLNLTVTTYCVLFYQGWVSPLQNPLPDWPSFELINIKLFADGCHVITATFKLNQSAMAKWYPEMEKLTLLEWQRFSYWLQICKKWLATENRIFSKNLYEWWARLALQQHANVLHFLTNILILSLLSLLKYFTLGLETMPSN